MFIMKMSATKPMKSTMRKSPLKMDASAAKLTKVVKEGKAKAAAKIPVKQMKGKKC